ncbi:hypothetical protein APED_04505 [Acanthopleuribacter pedis]|uniref:DUF962 domain-containing protein n=2 Tax=Acanthopleuribacter pedis TaxID=442870 RepID=A0A8J7QM45_9BACT|nr:hypothetical protein [Acanthopleuribacter pedis]MBO1320873.1 hypothetical protein [Acanthopleuribacter pedis]
MTFLEQLHEQRWDDHRYYHQSRINQTLHLMSAISFLAAYGLIFVSPAAAAVLGWIVAMLLRQIGHFFFEPKGYDNVNQATHQHKEAIKIGYNLQRKRILLAVWFAIPVLLYFDPSFFGYFKGPQDKMTYINNVGLLWLYLGPIAVLFRTIHLFFIYNALTGFVWAAKIFTDPIHDLKMYYKSPLFLMKGELFDDMVTHS